MLPIFLIVLVDIVSLTLVMPLLAIYAEHFHATPLEATLLVSAFAACQLFSGPLLGQISDRIGRRPLLIVSQIGTFVGLLVMANATSLWMLYLARVIDGSTAGNISLAQAYISDNTEPKDRAKSFGLIGIAFGTGFFIGPGITALLYGRFSFAGPIYAAAFMSFVSILCTTFLLPGGRPPQLDDNPGPGGKRLSPVQWAQYGRFFAKPILAGLLIQFFFYVFSFSTFTSGFALFAERTFSWHGQPFGPHEIGYVFAYAGLLGIVLQGGLIGRLVKRFGESALISVGFLTLTIAYVALGLIHQVGALILVATLSSFGNGVSRPTLTSLITQQAGRHEQGAVLGLNQSLQSVATIAAPILCGFLIERTWLSWWAWVAAIAAGAGWLVGRWRLARLSPMNDLPVVPS